MIENAIRSLFWAIAKLFLAVSDWVNEIIDMIININLSNSNIIIYTWLFMLGFLTFACFFRIAFVLLHQMADDEESIDVSKFLKKLGSVFLVVTVSVTFFNFSLVAPRHVINTYNNVITYDERMVASTAVISATAKTPISSDLDEMSTTDEVIGIDTIDEKLNDKEDEEYIYFNGYTELLLCIVGAFIVACLQLNLVTDLICRIFLNIFRFVIGFIPISSLVEDNSTCGEWFRDITSDTFMIMFIPVAMNMVYGFMSTSAITSLNGIVRIVVFTVALMSISKTGDFIAKYMGASNLSKGGKLGSTALGMGSMLTIRETGKLIRSASKYIPTPGKGKSNEKSGNGTQGNGGTGRTGTQTGQGVNNFSSSGGLGESISSTNPLSQNSDFFVNNGPQNSFQTDSLNQNMDESILDQSPTSQNIHTSDNYANSDNYTNSYMNRDMQDIATPSVLSDTNHDIQSTGHDIHSTNHDIQSGVDTKTSDTGSTSVLSTSPTDKVGTGKRSIDGLSSEDSSDKKRFSFRKQSPIVASGVGFVDSPTAGHLYKKSSSIYKQGVREQVSSGINQKNKANPTTYYPKDTLKNNGNNGGDER